METKVSYKENILRIADKIRDNENCEKPLAPKGQGWRHVFDILRAIVICKTKEQFIASYNILKRSPSLKIFKLKVNLDVHELRNINFNFLY